MAYMTTTELPDLTTSIKMLYHLPPAQAMLLTSLMVLKVATLDDLIKGGVAPSETTARSVVHRVRKFLLTKKIALQSAQSTGYWLSEEAKQIITAEVHAFNYPEG